MKRISLLILFLLIAKAVFAQYQPIVLPPSPNTSALSAYGNYRVSDFTGVPDITIPIYVVKSRNFSIPITLYYHASGIKVTDVSSWIGLGWALNVGGQISRKVMGLPDETPSIGLMSYPVRNGTTLSEPDDESWLYQVVSGGYDQQADIFSYDFPGHSGKFIYSNSGTGLKTYFLPYEPLKVSYDGNYEILDETGNIFDFKSKEITTNNNLPSNLQNTTTSWLLTQITDPNHLDSVMFTYTQNTGVTYDDYLDNVTVVDDYQLGNSIDSTHVHQTISIQEQKINTIIFNLGKIEFIPSSQNRQDLTWDQRLQYIKIYSIKPSGGYQLERTIEFFHSYFSTGSSDLEKRLRLDSIHFIGNDSTLVKRYSFNYDSTNLPARNSSSQDYLGYYNNKNNTNLIPHLTIDMISESGMPEAPITIGGANRNPDFTYTQADVLTRINYPTGGYTDFIYEPNKYKDVNTIKNSFGLRIYQIINYTAHGAVPVIKTYKYGEKESGYGKMNANLSLSCFMNQEVFGYNKTNCFEARKRIYYSYSTTDIFPWDGSPVFYSTVTEYSGDTIHNNGKIVNKYLYKPDTYDSLAGQGQIVRICYFWERGLPLETDVYKISGNKEDIIFKRMNTYQYFPNKDFLAGLQVYKDYEGSLCSPVPVYAWNNYYYFTGDNRITQSSQVLYNDNNPADSMVSTTDYAYSDSINIQLVRVTTHDSQGKTLEENLYYPDNSHLAFAPAEMYDPGNSDYKHMEGKVIESESLVNGALTNKRINKYELLNGRVLLTEERSFPTGNSDSLSVLYKYNNHGNIIQTNQEDGMPVTYLWGYNNSLLIAKIQNADSSQVASVLGANFNFGSGSLSSSQDSQLRNDLPQAMVTTYQYNTVNGIVNQIDPNGIKTTFNYDSGGRLARVRDNNNDIVKQYEYHYDGN